MKRISAIILFLSIFKFVASFKYEDLVGHSVHSEEDKAGFESLQKLTHPLDFKLESYIKTRQTEDKYFWMPTFIATIVRANHSQDQTPTKVYVKLLLLKEHEIDDLIWIYFANYKTNVGYLHLCQTADVFNANGQGPRHKIGYLAFETNMFSTLKNNVESKRYDQFTDLIVRDYLNKYRHPEDELDEQNQLRGFKLGYLIQAKDDGIFVYSAKISKLNSPANETVDAVVLFITEGFPNVVQMELAQFRAKQENQGKIIRVFKNAFVEGRQYILNIAVAIEVKNLDFKPLSQWISPINAINAQLRAQRIFSQNMRQM